MSYTLSEIKLAAFNWDPLPDAKAKERNLWQCLGYCYEWYRCHPEDKAACDELAKGYINAFEKGMMGIDD